jgi:4-amino-4-deoxy-L-arabinose transferase-like glycosyltransferase
LSGPCAILLALSESIIATEMRPFLFLFFSVLILETLGNNALPLIDRDEPRFAEASREMRQSGDFIIPRVNGAYRFDKPPLIYWCQSACSMIFGESDFSVRLPSAIFAAATVILTAAWASRLYGSLVGFWSGLVLGTCLQLFIHGRAAVADMPMIFFFTGATWAAWERSQGHRSFALWVCFYFALAAGFLAKGPVAFLPIIALLLFHLWTRTPMRFRPGSAVSGGLLVLIIIGLWGIPAVVLTHGEFFQVGIGKHVVMRSVAPLQSHGASGFSGYFLLLPFYCVTLFFSFLPWSLFLPGIIQRLRVGLDAFERFALCGIGVVFVVFSLLQTKLPHYTLPAFPLIAILVGRTIHESRFRRIAALSAVATYLLIALVGFQYIAPYFPSKRIFEQMAEHLSPSTRTASIGYNEPSLIWYLRYRTQTFHQSLAPSELSNFMHQPGPAVCVISADEAVEIDPSWQKTSVTGYDFSRWKVRTARFFGRKVNLLLPQAVSLAAYTKE